MAEQSVGTVVEPLVVFRGTFQECVQHLGKCYRAQLSKSSHKSTEARASIGRFCQVTDSTVVRWVKDSSNLPCGETRIRLMCYLDLIGFRVSELEGLKTRKGFAELIGYGLLTPQDAAEIIGYSNEQHLIRVLRPAEGISEEKGRRIFDAWKARRNELEERKEKSRIEYPAGFPLTTEKVVTEGDVEVVPQEKVPRLRIPDHTDIGFHQATRSLIFALAKLLQQPQIKELSPDEAKSLYLQYRGTIQDLSCGLCALSSKLIEKEEEVEGNDE
ncbi:MAG: hypothetical protein Q7S57_03925 [bacterium]|nr:hypothetical protein [bacterium]